MSINIRKYKSGDWKQVSAIYLEGINTKNATFENKVPEQKEWEAKQTAGCTLIAEDDKEIIGWVSITSVSSRDVYKGVGEVSIYVSAPHSGKGIGKLLMKKLAENADEYNIWTLQASIFPENKASIKLHLSCGFREVGYREKIGMMEGKWRNTLLFERRSRKI